MKQLMIIIDGMADRPCDALGGKTPREAAHTPALDGMAATGRILTTPEGFAVDSQTCILSILGVSAGQLPQGRAFLEALAAGIPTDPGDLLLRINLVGMEGDRLAKNCLPYTGKLPELEAFDFTRVDSGRGILRLLGRADLYGSFHCRPPHGHMDRPFDELLPSGCDVAERLADAALGMRNRTGGISFIPWSPSLCPALPDFFSLRGMSGAVVCGTPVVRGIALGLGLACPAISGATGNTDTDLASKLAATRALLRDHDFVLLHLNGADEAAHRRDPVWKAAFIGQVDRELLTSLLREVDDRPVVVLSDHATLSGTGAHDPMPVTVWCSRGDLVLSDLLPDTVQAVD